MIANKVQVIYADPAGNITAIVRGNVAREERIALAKAIMEDGRTEQVGFEVPPTAGGAGRLEMMGGEFCGNATRSYGYLLALEMAEGSTGHADSTGHFNSPGCFEKILVEISGAPDPIEVQVDIAGGKAYADMPLPVGIRMAEVDGNSYPVVCMEGIDHMIVENEAPSEDFVDKALKAMGADQMDAAGVIFLEPGTGEDASSAAYGRTAYHLTPVVYVRETDSLVWESSCGSGSVAASWYMADRMKDSYTGILHYEYREPGGCLEVVTTQEEGRITKILMGGNICLQYEN